MRGLTEHHHDGVRPFTIEVIYPGWTTEEVFCEEIGKARGRQRLDSLFLAVEDALEDGEIDQRCADNLLENIKIKLGKAE